MDKLKVVLEEVLGNQFIKGNKVDVLRNGDEIFPAMIEAIEQASDTIDMVTFVYWSGDIAKRFAKSLAQRAEAGVAVRVLLDAIGCKPMGTDLVDMMEQAGVEVRWFRPLSQWKVWKWDKRTHRKILVCDQNVAFTGGVGIAKEWEGDARNEDEWRETHFRILGPAVRAIAAGFTSNWTEAGGNIQTRIINYDKIKPQGDAEIQVISSPSSISWSDIATLFRVLIDQAETNLFIATAYFVPDEEMLDLFKKARKRGVSIKVMLPGEHSDQRLCQLSGEATYGELLNCGVEIHYYNTSMMHAKITLVDGQLAVIGSANMNHRSMSKDEELSLVIEDGPTLQILTAQFNDDLKRCTQLDSERWQKRSWTQQLSERFSRLFRQQL